MKPLILLLCFACLACSKSQPGNLFEEVHRIRDKDTTYEVRLVVKYDSVKAIATRRLHEKINWSEWEIDYPVYNIETGDVDGNGTDDILVGVIKKTKFDSVNRKRLFVFKLIDGLIRPLWLGSRMANPLEDFTFYKNKSGLPIVATIEHDGNKYLVAEYTWKSFGLDFIRYVKRKLNYEQAREILAGYQQ